MNNYYSLLTLLFATLAFSYQSKAQTPTYADDIAPILFENCTKCHHTGGIAPFPLMTYADASPLASLIQTSVNNGNMPPWPPDNGYQQFAHDRSLTATEIQKINDWVNGGAPQGNAANTPPQPTYNNSSQLGTPDMTLQIPLYASKATSNNDDYVCFSLPSGLGTNRTIKAIEIIPGDPSIVHHCLAYLDPNGTYSTDTTSHACGGPSSLSIPLIAGFAPGGSPAMFPDDPMLRMGIDMQAGSNVILAMHYPEGSQGMYDSTQINIHFYPQSTTGIRQVSANPVLADMGFTINANTVDSIEVTFPGPTTPLPSNFSMYSVFPHAHLLGQSFIIYAVNHFPPYDQIPLIHIPKWDFEWQDFYVFKYLQKIPAGYKLYGKCIYDNTTNNPYNPNTPPQNVSAGLNTSDEMFLVYFQYMTYQAGDENINVDSILQSQLITGNTPEPLAVNEAGVFFTNYPNPTSEQTTLHYHLEEAQEVSLAIYDVNGRLVRQLLTSTTQDGEQLVQWDGTNDSGNKVAAGLYISQLHVDGKVVTSKITRQ